MKAVLIGAEGHYTYAVDAFVNGSCELAGAALTGDALPARLTKAGVTAPVFGGVKELLDEVKPDIAVVNTVFSENAAISEECLKRGVHVFSEKPLATTLDSLDSLEAAYKSANAGGLNTSGVKLCAMLGLRYAPNFYTAKKLLDGGAVGEIRLMSAQKSYKLGVRPDFYKKRQTYGGTLAWVAIHAVDWISWLSGLRFTSATAYQSDACNDDNGGLETASACLFGLENGVMATVTADYLRPAAAPTHDDDRIRIAGSKGVLELRGGGIYLTDRLGERKIEAEKPDGGIFEAFLRCIDGGKCDAEGEQSLYATRAALLATLSADTKTTVAFDTPR